MPAGILRFIVSYLRGAGAATATAAIMGCTGTATVPDELPIQTVPARIPGRTAPLVVVLPGRGDDLDRLRRRGIAELIQAEVPDAEVTLVGATLPYYLRGDVLLKIHDQVILPARQRGIRDIWLVGISLGGMGALLYEHDYPGSLSGLVLLSPYLGETDVVNEVAARGLQHWSPGHTLDRTVTGDAPRQEWTTVKRWGNDPARATRIWLACGAGDKFYPAAAMIATLLPASHVYLPEGSHNWSSWRPAVRELFHRIQQERTTRSP